MTSGQTEMNSTSRLPAGTRLGPVHIAVTDADAALSIWRDIVGLELIENADDRLVLGADGNPLIILHRGATGRVVRHATGLYHVAIHVPKRSDLAFFVARAAGAGLRIAPTDHLVSEAIYLWDHDGNGIEITFETPWRGTLGNAENGFQGTTTDGRPHSGREPIDMDDLMREIENEAAVPALMPQGTRIGHVHVHVNNLEAAMRFYAQQIGFAPLMLMHDWGMGDAGLDYPPHAIAFNIWAGEGARPAPEGSAGLRWFTLVVPDTKARAALETRLRSAGAPLDLAGTALETRDPSGNRLRIEVAQA